MGRSSWSARHPITAYFVWTFAISWTLALAVASPHLLRREPLPQLTGILMFPVMLLGPSVTGVFLSWRVGGKDGLRDLAARLMRLPSRGWWLAALLLPPAGVLAVLWLLKAAASPAFTPNFFPIGAAFGVPAGVLEEIGWTGYAFSRMRERFGGFRAALILGALWSLWHLPVIDYLGTAYPHRDWLPEFFLAFALAMTAMRVLISWLYSGTGSVPLAQLMHISSTGSLVIFGAPHASAPQEAAWYALYGVVLWFAVALVVAKFGVQLSLPPAARKEKHSSQASP